MNKIPKNEIVKRRYCVECNSDAKAFQTKSDGEYDYYLCGRCGSVWKYPCVPEDVVALKKFLEEQLAKVDALIEKHGELSDKYPNNFSLKVAYESLIAHRRILCTGIEIIKLPVPPENIEIKKV